MAGECITPNEAHVPLQLQSLFGEAVELVIQADYCKDKGGCQVFLSPGTAQTDFFDVAMGFSRCRHLAAYLESQNPGLDGSGVAAQCETKKDSGAHFPIPDIISHEPDRTEFYEIKPNSVAGRAKGQDKILWFEALCADKHLPYLPGTRYNPDQRQLVWDGTWFAIPITVRLHWFSDQAGLLVWELCWETDANAVAEALVALLIALIVASLIEILLPAVAVGGAVAAMLAFAGVLTSPMAGPVGPGTSNAGADVTYAQLLINDWRGHQGLQPVPVDGQFGSLGTAITDYQSSKGMTADGELTPGGATIRALESDNIVGVTNTAVASLITAAGLPDDLQAEWISEPADDADSDTAPIVPLSSDDIDNAMIAALQNHLDTLYTTGGSLITVS